MDFKTDDFVVVPGFLSKFNKPRIATKRLTKSFMDSNDDQLACKSMRHLMMLDGLEPLDTLDGLDLRNYHIIAAYTHIRKSLIHFDLSR